MLVRESTSGNESVAEYKHICVRFGLYKCVSIEIVRVIKPKYAYRIIPPNEGDEVAPLITARVKDAVVPTIPILT
jgi:hypothetical protein